MKTFAKVIGALVALVVAFLIFGAITMTPEKAKAYEMKERADAFCKRALEDSAPGGERRQTRAICDRLQAEAEQRIRDAK